MEQAANAPTDSDFVAEWIGEPQRTSISPSSNVVELRPGRKRPIATSSHTVTSSRSLENQFAFLTQAIKIMSLQVQTLLAMSELLHVPIRTVSTSPLAGSSKMERTNDRTPWLGIERRLPAASTAAHEVRVKAIGSRSPKSACPGNRAEIVLQGPHSLTETERFVVRLVAQGMTNREVANVMYLSHRTIDSHVSHSLGKLGLSSRVQLAGLVALKVI